MRRDSYERAGSGPLLKDQAYERILGQIVSGERKPGDRISERGLSAELQMSKTPIKAALERLEEQGFVTLSPQRSAEVRAMSDREIADHYELRMAVETFVVSRLAGRLPAASARKISQILDRQREITAMPPPLIGWAEADYAFHLALAEALGNEEIVKIIALHRDRLRWLVRAIARQDHSVPPKSYAEHRRVFDLLLEDEPEQAALAMRSHLQHGLVFVLRGGAYGEDS